MSLTLLLGIDSMQLQSGYEQFHRQPSCSIKSSRKAEFHFFRNPNEKSRIVPLTQQPWHGCCGVYGQGNVSQSARVGSTSPWCLWPRKHIPIGQSGVTSPATCRQRPGRGETTRQEQETTPTSAPAVGQPGPWLTSLSLLLVCHFTSSSTFLGKREEIWVHQF